MAVVLVRNWWALALRGALAVLFGVASFVMPGLTLVVLIALFGAYALIDGVLAIVAGVNAAEHHERFGSLLWRGVLGIATAVVAFILPGATAVVLTLIIGAWAIVTGVLEIVAAVHLHRAHGECPSCCRVGRGSSTKPLCPFAGRFLAAQAPLTRKFRRFAVADDPPQ